MIDNVINSGNDYAKNIGNLIFDEIIDILYNTNNLDVAVLDVETLRDTFNKKIGE